MPPQQKASAPVPDTESSSGTGLSPAAIQKLVDEAAGFNLFAIPEQTSGPGDTMAGAMEFTLPLRLHRFDVMMQRPKARGAFCANTVGELVGSLTGRWAIIPDDFVARPDREPPLTPLDPKRSQRFAMQPVSIRLGNDADGFTSFGTGRTFPAMGGGKPRIVVGAIGTVTEGTGRFKDHEGNFSICGDLTPTGFQGNILVRIQDFQGNLRSAEILPMIQGQPDPDPQMTYFLWGAQKGDETSGLQNHFSFGPDHQIRGMNITTQLLLLQLNCAATGNFVARPFSLGKEIVGTEIGYGRLPVPGASQVGTQMDPTLFEGVSEYTFVDKKGQTVGSVLANFVEGRRFDFALPGAPGVPGLRFGFFGPIIRGSGCFADAQGMFYGSSGSVFNPPPGDHVITHFYMMRLNDPTGRFRPTGSSRRT